MKVSMGRGLEIRLTRPKNGLSTLFCAAVG